MAFPTTQSIPPLQVDKETRRRWMTQAIALYRAQAWVWRAYLLFTMLPPLALYVLIFIPISLYSSRWSGFPIYLFLFIFGLGFIQGLYIIFLYNGAMRAALKQLRGEAISIGDLFSGGRGFLRVWGVMTIIAFLTTAGFFCLIVPGFIVSGLFSMAVPLAVDQPLSIRECLTRSARVAWRQLWGFTLFGILSGSRRGGMAVYLLRTAVAYNDLYYDLNGYHQAPPVTTGQPLYIPPPYTPAASEKEQAEE